MDLWRGWGRRRLRRLIFEKRQQGELLLKIGDADGFEKTRDAIVVLERALQKEPASEGRNHV